MIRGSYGGVSVRISDEEGMGGVGVESRIPFVEMNSKTVAFAVNRMKVHDWWANGCVRAWKACLRSQLPRYLRRLEQYGSSLKAVLLSATSLVHTCFEM